ncbi:MAG: pirin family protein [Chitinophagaceae bacterium]|nr:pirin family protein [Chitinophagaceae bacterium]
MNQVRSVAQIFETPTPHFVGDGFRVHNFIPGFAALSMQRMDPFIMLDYNSPHYFPPADTPRGVDVHPHRGFETVTIAYQGKVEHHDSSGGGGIISEGDVQWMTAARGVLHKEFHEKEWSKQGGWFQMVQLWVNLPSAHKMSTPKYQALENNQFGIFHLPSDHGLVEVIAGNYQGIEGPASTFTPIHMYNLKLSQGANLSINLPSSYNTGMVVINGSISVNELHKAQANHFILMQNDGEEFTVSAEQDAFVLVLSGEPIGEPIAAHGPFVMNTREEIIQAFEDFHQGKFGHLD